MKRKKKDDRCVIACLSKYTNKFVELSFVEICDLHSMRRRGEEEEEDERGDRGLRKRREY